MRVKRFSHIIKIRIISIRYAAMGITGKNKNKKPITAVRYGIVLKKINNVFYKLQNINHVKIKYGKQLYTVCFIHNI